MPDTYDVLVSVPAYMGDWEPLTRTLRIRFGYKKEQAEETAAAIRELVEVTVTPSKGNGNA